MSLHARSLHRLAVARRDTDTLSELVLATGLSRRAVQEALREPAQDPPEDRRRELTAEQVLRWQARAGAADCRRNAASGR